MSSEIIEFIELIENPQLDQEIEPTQATQFEIPSLYQEVNLQETKELEQEHYVTTGLLTPSTDTSLSCLTTPDVEPPTTPGSINTATQSQQAPQARHIAPRDINLDISEVNIVSGPRQRRRNAYYAALEQPQEAPGFHAAFAAGVTHRESPSIPKAMKHQLPPLSKSWKEMLHHPHSQGFRAAAEKEIRALSQHNTFKPTTRLSKESGKQIFPLMWIFLYKFNQDGYLTKYKARLCIRGDLQKMDAKDTYVATLAVQVFRALMGITAAHNLEAKQLDAVNAFVNSVLDEEIYCECPLSYKHLEPCLLVLHTLYRLQ